MIGGRAIERAVLGVTDQKWVYVQTCVNQTTRIAISTHDIIPRVVEQRRTS